MRNTLTFRIFGQQKRELQGIVRAYGFVSLSQLLSLILTEAVYNKKLPKRVIPSGDTVVAGCRLDDSTYSLLSDICCKQFNDTVSVYGFSAVYCWLQRFEREKQKIKMPQAMRNYGADYARKVASLQRSFQ